MTFSEIQRRVAWDTVGLLVGTKLGSCITDLCPREADVFLSYFEGFRLENSSCHSELTPFGILMVAGGALMLLFGSHETSDAWVDALQMWWGPVKADLGHVRRLVIYLDNGPKNSGRRTQFLKRMVEFADWSGLEIRLVYYPPYHSKYNRIERCWSSLEKKWNGVLLNGVEVVLQCARG